MTGAVLQKICGLCGQDCANRPRTKDKRGRYFCSACYDRAIARKRQQRGLAPPSPPPPPLAQSIHNPTTQAAARSPESAAPPPPFAPPPLLLPPLAVPPLPPAPEPLAAARVEPVAAFDFESTGTSAANGHMARASPAQEMVESRSLAASADERPFITESRLTAPASDAVEEALEFKEAPRVDAEAPATPIEDPQQIKSTEPEFDPSLSLELPSDDLAAIVAPPPEPTFEQPAPGSLSTVAHTEEPRLEQAPEAAPLEAPLIDSPALETPPAVPSPIAASIADESDTAEPSFFELEPEEQREWPSASESAATEDQQKRAVAFEVPPAPSPSRAAPHSVIGAAVAPSHGAIAPRDWRVLALNGGPVPTAFAGCPHCHRLMPTGAVVCLACGFNTLSGVRSDEDVARPISRRRARSGWTGPILMGSALTLLALGGGYLLFGTRAGALAYGIALVVSVPAWFAWSVIDARDTEGAQLKIWLVPGYIIAWVFSESRSRYLRAATIALVVITGVFAVLGYQWRLLERQHTRAVIDQRASAGMPD